jgi:N-acetylneuraminic acid mutarotase
VKKIDPTQAKQSNQLPAFVKTFLSCFAAALFFVQAAGQSSSFNTIRWSTVAPQPYVLNEGQSKVVNGKLYSFGGFDSRKSTFTATKRAYVYNPEKNTWTPIADLPFTPTGADYGGVTHAGIATDGADIYIAGGYTSNTAGTGQIFGTNQVWRYNVASNTYTKMPNLPFELSAGQMEYANGKLHYIGGTNKARTTDLGTHYVLDVAANATTWDSLAPLPNPRHHGGSAVVNGKIYYIGGQHEHDAELMAQKDVHMYNPSTNTWTQVADLPVPAGATGRGHITSSVVVVNNQIIVLAGETDHHNGRTNMVSSYDPATNTWTNLTPLPQSRYSGVAGFIGNSIYYSGGSGSSITYRGDLAISENIISAAPLADAFVRDGTYANDNYGNDTSLLLKTNTTTTTGYKRRAYLKFPANASNIVTAKLRLYGYNTENNTNTYITVKGLTNDTWTETGITWNNAPALPAGSLYTNVINGTKAYYEFDVTGFVKAEAAGDGLASFVVLDTAKQNRTLSFNSKEFGSNPPELIITTDGSAPVASESILFTQSSQSVEVEQGSEQTLLEFIATSNNQPTSVNLEAVDENGLTPSWLSVNGKPLHNLAYTSGSEISFEFDATNLSIGTYSASVTATAPGYKQAVLNIFLTVKAGASGNLTNLRVNFQDSATAAPAGWVKDFGQAFGARTTAGQGSGNTYGWLSRNTGSPVSLVGNGRNRKTPADVTLATFMHVQANQVSGSFTGVKVEGIWEAQVANGNYDVSVSVGDASYYDSKHSINIEGVPAIVNFTPSSTDRFRSATITVSVSDGKLTMEAIGGTNTKVNYISIQPTASKRPSVVRVNPESGSQYVSENSSVSTSILNLPNGGVNNATVTPANVYLKELSTGIIVPANVNGTGGGDAITLVPTTLLKLNTAYQFTITDSVKDLSGASFIPYTSTFTTSSAPSGDMNTVTFSTVKMPQITGRHSSLKVGPDGKLYALTIDGIIKRFPINPDGTLGNAELLYSLQDFGGTRTEKLAIGFAFDPAATADNLIAYVTHSSFVFLNGPEWDGHLTRLSGANLENVQPVLVGLPRSAKDHLTNSIAFGPDGALYFTQGSLSAMGRADQTWQNRDEAMLSAAVLRLDMSKITTLPLNVRTIADGGDYNPLDANAPLTIYASGVRNAYDLVWHSNGELYVPTNGSAAGGNTPASVAGASRIDGTSYNGPVIPALSKVQQTQRDFLFRVQKGGYYGHPNPKRGEFVLNGGNPTSTIDPGQVDAYPVGTMPDTNWRGFAFDFQTNKSPNGAIEYKSSIFNGALKGKLMVVRYSQNDDIIVLTPGTSSTDIASFTEGVNIPGFSGFVDPLDLTEDTITGNIYISEYGGEGTITLIRPGSSAPESTTPGGVITVNPKRLLDNDVSGGAGGTPRMVTIKNTGTAAVAIASITMGGTNPEQFALSNMPSLPLTINPGDSVDIFASFNPTSAGLKTAAIHIKTVDSANVAASVPFRALGTTGLGGSNEPSLQAILDLYQTRVSVGDDAANTAIINSNTALQKAALLGEEVALQQFVKAGDGNVTIEPLAVFGPTANNPIVGMGWYKSGDSTTKTELLTVSNSPASNGQTVNAKYTGTLSFDPGSSSFGFYTRWPFFGNRHLYSDDKLNTFAGAIPHHVRVYPYRGADTIVPNKYIVAFEETISSIDYQDFVFVVSNVKSTTDVNFPVVTLAPDADAFVRNGSYANTNYGKDTILTVKTNNSTSTGFNRHTYLKFPLASVSTVTSAKLRLYGRNIDDNVGNDLFVYGIDNDSWTETGITWNNAPTTTNNPLSILTGVNNRLQYYEVDVTAYVKAQVAGDKTVTFQLRDALLQDKHINFNSRENKAFIPQLIISTAPAGPLRNNQLFVENLDKFPSNDYFVTSRLQTPWTRDTIYNADHDLARVRIHNKGQGTLVISKLAVSNNANWSILTLKGAAYDSAAAFPTLVNSGSYVDVNLKFIASNVSTSRYVVLTDNLVIESNDDKNPTKVVTLRGLWQKQGEGSREPNAQTMISVFGFSTKTGFSSTDPDLGNASKPKGNEVISSYFVRADTTKPVYVRQMGAYHGCCQQKETFRWFTKGTSTFNSAFSHIEIDAQTLLPRRSISGSAPAEAIFSPKGSFGFKVGSNDHTDTLKNPGRKIGIRVWRAIDINGKVIPDAFIVANDYLGTEFTNFDYNDNMYWVTNIKPEFGPANGSLLAALPSAVDFESKTVQSSNVFTLKLKNLGQTTAAGVADPALAIKGFVIKGENKDEFKATLPVKTTLTAGDSTTMTVTFSPATQGLKSADLMVYFNTSASPLRVPLYGIGLAQNSKATVVNRIKSGSSTSITVKGKVWSADTQYAFDNLEPFRNPSVKEIAATDEDSVYVVEQSSNADKRPFRYEIAMPNGDYHVRLHFAEIYWGAPGSTTGLYGGAGSRVMTVALEGSDRLINLDVAQEVGTAAALVKNLPVTVSDGKLNINFSASANRPMVCGIEVYKFEVDGTMVNTQLPPNIVALPSDPTLLLAAQRLRVYPNPVKDKFQVTLPASYQGTVMLQLVDVLGHVHQLANTKVRAGGTVLNVDISPLQLKQGVYFLKVIGENREPEMTKLVIE